MPLEVDRLRARRGLRAGGVLLAQHAAAVLAERAQHLGTVVRAEVLICSAVTTVIGAGPLDCARGIRE